MKQALLTAEEYHLETDILPEDDFSAELPPFVSPEEDALSPLETPFCP